MTKFILIFILAVFFCVNISQAKPKQNRPGFGGGFEKANLEFSEMTGEQHAAIKARLAKSVDSLKAAGILPEKPSKQSVVVHWPLSCVLSDPGYWRMGHFPDHDTRKPGYLLDYMGGNRTYDRDDYNHAGTDFFGWPFDWCKMDNMEVIVIAACAGTIIDKDDGNFDKRCATLANGTHDFNSVYIQHSDGSIAWYTHFKNGSLTTKAIGQTVDVGEYLGVIGSSGMSWEPHLHFELEDVNGHMVDPNVGPENPNPSIRWADGEQPPYYDSAINKLMTHSTPPRFYSCPNPADINEKNNFNAGDSLYVAAYYRDQLSGQTATYTIYRPDNSVFQTWTHDIVENFPHPTVSVNEPDWSNASHWYWGWVLPSDAPDGTWRVEAVFEGITYQHEFEVGPGETWFDEFTITGPTATFYRMIAGDPFATDNFDTGIDSSLSAPASDFYAAFRIPTSPNYLIKDTRFWGVPFDTPIDWTMRILNSGGSPVTVQWDSTALPAEGCFLLDGLGYPVDMRKMNMISFSGDIDLSVNYTQSVDFTFNFTQSGWYLVSLPVEPANNSLSTLFPDVLIAYTWDPALQQYVTASQLEAGIGYWLAVLDPHSVAISGMPVSRHQKNLTMGWHQVGALFTPTDFANPLDTPDGSIVAAYRYNTTTGNYELVQSLDAQEGYWIAAVDNCNLLLKQLSPTAAKSSPQNMKLTEDYIRQFGSTPPPPPAAMGIAPTGLQPREFSLGQNYPNPFNPVTNVRFSLSSRERIQLSVFNLLGQKVATLATGVLDAGLHEIRWQGRDDNGVKLPSGVYFYKLIAGKKQLIHKMVLSK